MRTKKVSKRETLKIHRALVDWFFACCVAFLDTGVANIRYKDFSKSKMPEECMLLGEIEIDEHSNRDTIYIDHYRGNAVEILHHELMHGLFSFPARYDSEDVMTEERIHAVSDTQWKLLTKKQKEILRSYLPAGRGKGASRPKHRTTKNGEART